MATGHDQAREKSNESMGRGVGKLPRAFYNAIFANRTGLLMEKLA
jgi:hypothetical protein